MPEKVEHSRHFMVLLAGDIVPNLSQELSDNKTIFTATHPDKILNYLSTVQFDLILLDIMVSGIDYMTPLKKPDCINNKTPVVAFLNQPDCLKTPNIFDDNFLKPITEQQLVNLIALWGNKSRANVYIQNILNKTKNNRQLALTLFNKLFEELPLQIQGIKEALENNHYELAREITHTLHGSVSFCGLTEIQQPANALEICLTNNHYAEVPTHFLRLRQCAINFTGHQQFIMTNFKKMPAERND